MISTKSTILVLLQLGALTYLTLSSPIFSPAPWLVLQIFAVAIAVWGVWSLRLGNFNIQPEVRASELVQSGIYRWLRNPMYLGLLLFFLPTTLLNPDVYSMVTYLLLIIVLILKIFSEEQLLLAKFGEEYSHYKSRSSRLLPFIF